MFLDVIHNKSGGVPSCPIENKNYFLVDFSQSFQKSHRDCCELFLHKFVVEFPFESVCAINIGILRAAIHMDNQRLAYRSPAAPFVSISTEMSFIYTDDFVTGSQREGLPLEVFLKMLTALSFLFLCSGRGTFHDIPTSWTMRRKC